MNGTPCIYPVIRFPPTNIEASVDLAVMFPHGLGHDPPRPSVVMLKPKSSGELFMRLARAGLGGLTPGQLLAASLHVMMQDSEEEIRCDTRMQLDKLSPFIVDYQKLTNAFNFNQAFK